MSPWALVSVGWGPWADAFVFFRTIRNLKACRFENCTPWALTCLTAWQLECVKVWHSVVPYGTGTSVHTIIYAVKLEAFSNISKLRLQNLQTLRPTKLNLWTFKRKLSSFESSTWSIRTLKDHICLLSEPPGSSFLHEPGHTWQLHDFAN